MLDAPSLETFKVRLDWALSNLLKSKMALLMAGGLDDMTFRGPYQPKLFCDYMKIKSHRIYLHDTSCSSAMDLL